MRGKRIRVVGKMRKKRAKVEENDNIDNTDNVQQYVGKEQKRTEKKKKFDALMLETWQLRSLRVR
jgi:hypothetical protein